MLIKSSVILDKNKILKQPKTCKKKREICVFHIIIKHFISYNWLSFYHRSVDLNHNYWNIGNYLDQLYAAFPSASKPSLPVETVAFSRCLILMDDREEVTIINTDNQSLRKSWKKYRAGKETARKSWQRYKISCRSIQFTWNNRIKERV